MNRVSLRGTTGFSLVVLTIAAIASPVSASSRGEFPDGLGSDGGRHQEKLWGPKPCEGDRPGSRDNCAFIKGYAPPDEGLGSGEPDRTEGSGTRLFDDRGSGR